MPPLALCLALAAPTLVTIDAFDQVDAWKVNPDGGGGLAFSRTTDRFVSPPSALRLVFDASGPNPWGNLARPITMPTQALAVTLKLYVVKAAPGAAMHLWLFQPNGDAWMTEIRVGGQRLDSIAPGAWLTVRIPLADLHFDPRGGGKPNIESCNRMLLGCNFAPLEVDVDDLAFECGPPPSKLPLPRSESWQPVDGPKGRIAVLDEPGLARTPGGLDPAKLAPLLTAAGYGVTRVRAGDVADAARLTRDTFDLLLINAPGFPGQAKAALLAYLRGGGAVLSVGGYAFDRPQTLNDDGWADLSQETPAGEWRINTRYGKPGDTMGTEPTQIGLFDPTALLTRVASAELGGKRVEGQFEGLAGVSMAGSNSPVFPDMHGETEFLGQAYDKYGRPRGALGVLAQFFDGPFKGGAWGGFGVTNRDLFADDAFGTAPLLAAIDRLVSGVFLYNLHAEPVFVHDPEPVRPVVSVLNRGRRSASARLQVSGLGTYKHAFSLRPGQTETLEVSSAPVLRDSTAVQRFTAGLELSGEVVDTRENACVIQADGWRQSGRGLALKGNYFETAGRPVFLTGTNQTGVMWHSPRENPLTWDRDFQAMADSGLTLWRVLHWSPFATGVGAANNPLKLGDTPPDKLVRQTDAIVQIAQSHGVVLFPCAHDWIGIAVDDEVLAAERKWCAWWSHHYQDVPGLIWDIENEPSVTWNANAIPAYITQLYQRYLTERHGSLDAARAWLGATANEALTPKAGNGAWNDLRAVSVEEFRTWLVQRWIEANVAGLKEGNPNVLVTVGFLQTRSPADKIEGVRHLDFANAHSYETSRQFATSLRFIDHRAAGKSMTLGEFGARALHDVRVHGGDGEAGDADRKLFTTTVGLDFGMGGGFANNWCFRGLPDVIFPWELYRSDRVPRPSHVDFAALTLAFRGVEPVYDPPATYLLIPDENRLGPHYNDIDAALARAIDTLIGLHVPFALLNEHDLTLPKEARAILWPLPYCPQDAAFDKVRAWVADGGHLYLSGDVGFDERRQYTKGARLAALNLPATAGADPFGVPIKGAAPIVSRVEKGTVTFVPEPAELRDGRLRGLYADFLAAAGITRWPVTPDVGEVQAGLVPSRDGSRAWVAASWGAARDVTFEGGVTLHVAADDLGWVHLGAGGEVRGVLAQGKATSNGALLDAPGPALVLSRDERDVRDSARLCVVPLGAGEVKLVTRHAWRAPLMVTGEVHGGQWHELARQAARVEGGVLHLNFDEADLDTLVVVAEPDEVAATAGDVVRAVALPWHNGASEAAK